VPDALRDLAAWPDGEKKSQSRSSPLTSRAGKRGNKSRRRRKRKVVLDGHPGDFGHLLTARQGGRKKKQPEKKGKEGKAGTPQLGSFSLCHASHRGKKGKEEEGLLYRES